MLFLQSFSFNTLMASGEMIFENLFANLAFVAMATSRIQRFGQNSYIW